MGVLQTTVAEIVTVKEHQRELAGVCVNQELCLLVTARAYSIMPFVWCLG